MNANKPIRSVALCLRVLRGARCGNSARRDLRGGRRAIGVPTSIGELKWRPILHLNRKFGLSSAEHLLLWAHLYLFGAYREQFATLLFMALHVGRESIRL